MQKGYGEYWRRLGRVEKAFLISVLLYVILFFTHIAPTLQAIVALAAFFLGIVTLFRLARRGMKKAIWRLRNRLIAAYLFIAVVPIVLILTLVGLAGWAVIGQMAIYLINTEIGHRVNGLVRQADITARFVDRDPEGTVSRFVMSMRTTLPNCVLRVKGKQDIRYPADSTLEPPPAELRKSS